MSIDVSKFSSNRNSYHRVSRRKMVSERCQQFLLAFVYFALPLLAIVNITNGRRLWADAKVER